jgi:hypothetical protein
LNRSTSLRRQNDMAGWEPHEDDCTATVYGRNKYLFVFDVEDEWNGWQPVYSQPVIQ